jgi:chromosome segregation ATPase
MTTTKKDSIEFEKQIEKLKKRPDFAEDLKHHDDRGELDLTRVIDKYKKENIELKSQLVEKETLLKGTRKLVEDYVRAGYKYANRVKELEKISRAHQAQVGEQMVELKFQTTKADTLEKQVTELKKDNKKLAQQIDDLTNIMNKGEFGK